MQRNAANGPLPSGLIWSETTAILNLKETVASRVVIRRDAGHMADELTIPIESERDIVIARRRGRELAARIGFSATDQISIATAISEISRNVLESVQGGEIQISSIRGRGEDRVGLQAVALEKGSAGSKILLGLKRPPPVAGDLLMRLSTTRRTMDEFEIMSGPRKGTAITIRKWKR
ncbi:MAG TPA: ATP-binding protein [Planctomycetota bacterium]|nr:ATP-binding protein [Planctomycetota bacterium]